MDLVQFWSNVTSRAKICSFMSSFLDEGFFYFFQCGFQIWQFTVTKYLSGYLSPAGGAIEKFLDLFLKNNFRFDTFLAMPVLEVFSIMFIYI